jgi:hypothetical protein
MKKLFILVSDAGDGSYSPRFTFNEKWIKGQEKKYDNGEITWPDLGCDGDGFHYTVLTVPDDCTLESLGIRYDCAGQ